MIYIFQPNLHKMVGNNSSLAFGNRTYLAGEVPHTILGVLCYLYPLCNILKPRERNVSILTVIVNFSFNLAVPKLDCNLLEGAIEESLHIIIYHKQITSTSLMRSLHSLIDSIIFIFT